MAIKKLTHTGEQLDTVVQLYDEGKRNTSKATITSIQLKAGKVAIGSTGSVVYGEAVEYTGDQLISPSDKDVIIEKGHFTTKDITIDKINLQEKSVDSAQVVDADEGYYLSNVFIKGRGKDYIGPDYVSIPATTYKPSTVNQIIMGPKLFIGEQRILGDPNLAPRNIGKGIKLFGMVGTFQGEEVAQVAADGKSWTQCTGIVPTGTLLSCYGDGIWVAIDSPGTTAYYSTDGITWISIQMPNALTWTGIAYGEGRFVAIASGTSICAYSDDGITWKRGDCYAALEWSDIIYGNGRFVAVANNTETAQFSSDGINWLYCTLGKVSTWSDISYLDGLYFAVSKTDGNSACSYDGEEWISFNMSNYAISKIVSTGNALVAIINNSTKIVYSYDGFTWAEVDLDPDNELSGVFWVDVAYGNGKILLLGNTNTLAYSIDCVTWKTYSSNIAAAVKLSYGNNKFILSARSGVYYSSTTLDI